MRRMVMMLRMFARPLGHSVPPVPVGLVKEADIANLAQIWTTSLVLSELWSEFQCPPFPLSPELSKMHESANYETD